AEIVLLHVAEVDQGVPLRAGIDEGERIVPFLEEAKTTIANAGIPARSIVQVSHRISQGILETAIEQQANFIILSRERHPTFLDQINASVIDTVLDRAPCEVAILHGELNTETVKNVMIPFSENIHTQLAFEIMPAILDHFKSKAEVVVVFEPDMPSVRKEEELQRIDERVRTSGIDAQVKVTHDKGILEGVVLQSKKSDLIIMGGRSGEFLGLLVGQSLTQEITEQAACPVLWVNEYEERTSLWKAFFRPVEKEIEDHG
ncbi:MAG: universal stress protein, partial [bacterium]